MPQDESRGVRVAGTGHGSCQESFTRGWKLGPEARARLLLLDFAKMCQPRSGSSDRHGNGGPPSQGLSAAACVP